MTPNLNLWLIPVLPLAGAAINGFLGKKSSRTAVSTVALFFPGAAFAWALLVVLRGYSSLPYMEYLAHWIRSGSFTADFPSISISFRWSCCWWSLAWDF